MVIRHLMDRLATIGRGQNYRLFVPHLRGLLGQDLAKIPNSLMACHEDFVQRLHDAFRDVRAAHENFNRYPIVLAGYGSMMSPHHLDSGILMCTSGDDDTNQHPKKPSVKSGANQTKNADDAGEEEDRVVVGIADTVTLVLKPGKVRMIPVKDSFPYPDVGLRNEDGHLFHHVSTHSMKDVHLTKLELYGIHLRKDFTEAEDDRILKNYEAFAEEHAEKLKAHGWNLRSLTGVGNGRKPMPDLDKFRHSTAFWPRMCHGLPSRCAQTVRQRIIDLTDPNKDWVRRELTEEEVSQIAGMREDHSRDRIGEIMGLPGCVVKACIGKIRRDNLFSKCERKWLYDTVKKHHPELFTGGDWLIPATEDIKWKQLAEDMGRTAPCLRVAWDKILEKLKELRERQYSFEDALVIVLPEYDMLNLCQMADLADLLPEVDPNIWNLYPNEEFEEELEKKMKERGLTGFYTERYGETHYGRLIVGEILGGVRPVSLHLRLGTRCHLLARCLRTVAAMDAEGQPKNWRNLVVEEFKREAALLPAEDLHLVEPVNKE